MEKRKNIRLFIWIISLVLVLGLLGWFLTSIFEGEKPWVKVESLPEFLSENQKFKISMGDMKRGLKAIKVTLTQGDREITLFEKRFPFKGLLNREGLHRFDTKFSVDASKRNLAQGRVDLKIFVWDYSRRRGGDGNLALIQHKMVVDTIPPAIRAVSRMNYAAAGGTGLVLYQTSSDAIESGVFIDKLFFTGFPAGDEAKEGLHVCYFAIPYDMKAQPDISLFAKDKAGNRSKAGFYCHIRKKRFKKDTINISDRFLERVLPYFSFYSLNSNDSDVKKFLTINRKLRKENASAFFNMRSKTCPKQLWNGPWARLKNAATMATFGDHRSYFYKGEKIDDQVHLGVDLASLANSEVHAANNGHVIFADRMGIYGLTVVLDHGQALSSLYSHLSTITVQVGREVIKGEVIGLTGKTGLAGGDHLHFGIMAGGVPVNPLEWWDTHWIQDNITRKLSSLSK